MPSAIPDRFKLEMRLGRDGDIEEWLATDVSLDRPVLVRSLGPESSSERRQQFLESVSGAAAVTHPHLSKVFIVERVEGGAYAVMEWTGGSTVADHVAAEHTVDLAEFLPNASGLASALDALHQRGITHGAIDTSAISYSAAHPAKLGAFGRVPHTDVDGDVRALASALETALTGFPPIGPPPSERIDGLSPQIDRILRSAQAGEYTASAMDQALSAAPTPRAPAPEVNAGSKRLLLVAALLVVFAAGLVFIGFLFSGGSTEPIFPAQSVPSTTAPPTTSTTIASPFRVLQVSNFDPYGDGIDNDFASSLVIDGDLGTLWRTASYPEPLADIKPGVGLAFAVRGTPGMVEVQEATVGTWLEIRWSNTLDPTIEGWELIATAQASPRSTEITLPQRTDGFWLVWITEIPPDAQGAHQAAIAEVRFHP